ncbi:MAG: GlxA family transcriptional regulator [Pseudomonadota bacterium]
MNDATEELGGPTRVLLVPIDGFSLLSFAAVVDPLRAANRALGREAYAWSAVTIDGSPARASSGFSIDVAGAIKEAPPASLVIVCAGLETDPPGAALLLAELRRRARTGAAIGAVSTGARLLGRAGLLDDYRCTLHWEARAAFAAEHPDITVTEAPYEIDRKRYTSSGGTASIDMMLERIRLDHGAHVCRAVANQFQHERIRSNADRQRPASEPDVTGKPEVIGRLIRLMAQNIEEPLGAQALADSVSLSVRQVERLFERYVQSTPTNYYIGLRLARAQELLRQTSLSVLDVALATGFTSQSHFAQSYRTAYGRNPSEERK